MIQFFAREGRYFPTDLLTIREAYWVMNYIVRACLKREDEPEDCGDSPGPFHGVISDRSVTSIKIHVAAATQLFLHATKPWLTQTLHFLFPKERGNGPLDGRREALLDALQIQIRNESRWCARHRSFKQKPAESHAIYSSFRPPL